MKFKTYTYTHTHAGFYDNNGKVISLVDLPRLLSSLHKHKIAHSLWLLLKMGKHLRTQKTVSYILTKCEYFIASPAG